jgi:hypothetical protein
VKPEDALARARAELERKRSEGAYEEDLGDLRVPPDERLSIERLMEWGVIEPDLELVTSTRRFGAPIGWLKRTLEHMLRQYHRQLESQQTRFNLHLLTRIAELEDRIGDLELTLAERDREARARDRDSDDRDSDDSDDRGREAPAPRDSAS